MPRGLIWIDADPATGAGWHLPRDPAEVEPGVAAARALLRGDIDRGAVPFDVGPTVDAYVLVHRLRSDAAADAPPAACRLWAPALLESLGVGAHAAADLLALRPPDTDLVLVAPESDSVARAARRAGLRAVDTAAYAALVSRAAERESWVTLTRPDGDTGPPLRATASALLVHDSAVLLERRSDDAAVTPGVWDSPGGHLRPGEGPDACVVRELEEELGVRVRERRLVGVIDREEAAAGLRYRHFVYRVDAWDGRARPREAAVFAWHPLDVALRQLALPPGLAPCLERLAASAAAPTPR